MKELSSHPRSRLVNLQPHDNPLARFSGDEDSGPVRASGELHPAPDYQTQPHEVTGYLSLSGRDSIEPHDTVSDWSMGSTAMWESTEETPRYLEHRYEPRPPRTVPLVATAAVCGLLAYSLYLDRPAIAEIRSWLAGGNVIDLPTVASPPVSSRLADDPGRIAAPVALDSEPPPAAVSTEPTAETAKGLELVVGVSSVSIVPGRAAGNEPSLQAIKRKESTQATQPSSASLTRALNAASLAPGLTAATTAAKPAPSRSGDDAEVKRALSRFQVAYNALDVNGTRVVWPTVDTAALARVFQSLDSQRLELTGCQVATAGERAQAVCTGQARMVPKAKGKGPRVESRQWTFDLKRSIDRWDVVALNMK